MRTVFTAAILAIGSGTAYAQFVNVALNAPVSLAQGGPLNGAALSTVTDGAFLPRGTGFTAGVWWNGTATQLEIDLGGSFRLVGGIVQADDNDAYRLLYRDLTTNTFQTLWDVPNYDPFGAGLQTRPNPDDDTEIHFFGSAVWTDTIRVEAVSGDNIYSVSEVQVFTPAPGAAALIAIGALAAARRRR